MSIITPSRIDFQPTSTKAIHDHAHAHAPHHPHGLTFAAALQPSIMPPPAASTGVFDKSRLDQLGASRAGPTMGEKAGLDIGTWRKGVDSTHAVGGPASASRVALARVDSNLAGLLPTGVALKKKDGGSAVGGGRTTTPIPRPAVVPDVFADDRSNASTAKSTLIQASKRTREVAASAAASASTSTSKRARVEEDAWKSKWLKSFPNLVFHFEIGTEGNGKVLEGRVKAMGARVDQFFSTRVTHLIAKPSTSPKKAMPPPRRPAVKESKNPFSDGTGVTDLVQKAEALNIKVWTVDKLVQMLTRLAPVTAAKDSLHTLLEDERIHGTRERDLNAPRPDFYYFKPGSKYLLIEDAANKYRTIMVKEYNHAPKDGTTEWPTLFEKFLRPSQANTSTLDPSKIRDRAWALYVDGVPFEGEQPPLAADLKRTSSLRQLPSTPKLPEAIPYQNASGNSVVLTSNIASTSTAANSPALFSQNAMGMFKDRALSHMNKRVQVLKGNARLAAAKRSSTTEASIAELCSRRTSTPNHAAAAPTSASTEANNAMAPCMPAKTFLTYNQLVGMLEQARQPVVDSGVTAEMRIKNREKVDNGLKGREQETAAGYCENCRVRYNDLSVHIESKKHRRFATNDANFESLDKLLKTLCRPANPKISNPEFPPCEAEHLKDAECELCSYCPSEAMSRGVGGDECEGASEGEGEGEGEFLSSQGSGGSGTDVLSGSERDDGDDEDARENEGVDDEDLEEEDYAVAY